MIPSTPPVSTTHRFGDIATATRIDRDVVVDLAGEGRAGEDVSFRGADHEGEHYLMLRYRPDLPARPSRQRRDWVFLFEASGDLHRLHVPAKKFPMTGQDASPTGLQNILKGYQCGTVYKPISAEAQVAAAIAMYLNAGEKVALEVIRHHRLLAL